MCVGCGAGSISVRETVSNPSDPAQFLDLCGQPPFPAAVLLPDFLGALAQLA